VVHDYSGKLLMPGFIDTHMHYPQTDMIASPSEGLLPWLETYTFPTERQFEDTHAANVADFFLDELLRCGTTTAMVYCTVHPQSVDAFFAASEQRGLRMVAGKVMMDRNCPEFLRDTAESGARDTEALIQRWHKRGRSLYAITPRFAPTSTNSSCIWPASWRAPTRIPSSRPTCRKTKPNARGCASCSPRAQLHRRLRQLRHDASARHVRPLHLAQ
jgi:guanine deaminase